MERIILSAHLFQKNNLLEDTHNMLCLASDTNRLYKSIYGENLSNYDEAKYLKILEEIERITSLTRKTSILDVVKPFGTGNKIVIEDSCSDMSDSDIDKFSLTLFETMGIPSNRLENVKKDLLELRKFYKRRHCRNLILLQNLTHTNSKETLYSEPPLFLFDCLVKKWRTEETVDTEVLLDKLSKGVCCNCSDKIPLII
jgi:DNA mismatch repair ATPase MutS